jgi:O-antigen/teichoic acid export membrane protein
VEAYCSTKSLGNYVQVSKTGQLLLILPTIISSAIYPHASAGNNFNVIKLIYKMFAFFLVLYVFILIGSLLWSEAFFKIMFGNTFDEMYVPFLILVPGILFLSLHNIIAAFFGGNNKPLYNLISTGAGLLVVLAGDFLLIKNMGITAAALVSTLGYCTAFMVSFGLFVNRTGSAWKEIFSTDIFRLSTYTSILNPQPSQSK